MINQGWAWRIGLLVKMLIVEAPSGQKKKSIRRGLFSFSFITSRAPWRVLRNSRLTRPSLGLPLNVPPRACVTLLPW
jgi:hypothetical protein